MQKYGTFKWKCGHCGKEFIKDTPQGLGLARDNHLRTHTRWEPKKDNPVEIMTVCETCRNRLWPETITVAPGQNIRCKKGPEKNRSERGYSSDWVFQQKECKYFGVRP